MAFNKTKRFFKELRQDFMDRPTVYFSHSANLLTLKIKDCVGKRSFILII